MSSIQNSVCELNSLIKQKLLDRNRFISIVEELRKTEDISIRIVDFSSSIVARLERSRQEKKKAVIELRFKDAANQRKIERRCLSVIELKRRFRIRRPMFYAENGFLFFFYFGKAETEKEIKKMLTDIRKNESGSDVI